MTYTNLIVKKYSLFVIMFVLGSFMFAQSSFAGQYYKPTTSRVGVWADMGVNAWLMKNSQLKNSIGGGLGVGCVYEFQREHFLLNVGLGANMLYNPVKVTDATIVLPNQDDLDPLYYGGVGEKVDYYYDISNRQDKYLNLNIQVPVMVGFVVDRFFMLAGAKLGYMINLLTFTNANVSTRGYNQTIGWMHDMPMYQYYSDRSKSQQLRCSFKPDVALSVELGGYIGEQIKGTGYNRFRKPKQYRLSVFADYGLLSINQSSTRELITPPSKYVTPKEYDMVDEMSFRDAISSNIAGKLNNLFVGVKFTALFNLPEKPGCILCNSESRFIPRRTKTR